MSKIVPKCKPCQLPVKSDKVKKRHGSSCEALATEVRQTTQLHIEKHPSTIQRCIKTTIVLFNMQGHFLLSYPILLSPLPTNWQAQMIQCHCIPVGASLCWVQCVAGGFNLGEGQCSEECPLSKQNKRSACPPLFWQSVPSGRESTHTKKTLTLIYGWRMHKSATW